MNIIFYYIAISIFSLSLKGTAAEDILNDHWLEGTSSLVAGYVISKSPHLPEGVQIDLNKVDVLEGNAPSELSVIVNRSIGYPGGENSDIVVKGMRVLAIIHPSGSSYTLTSSRGFSTSTATLLILDENADSEIADVREALSIPNDPDQMSQNRRLTNLISNPKAYELSIKIVVHQLVKRASRELQKWRSEADFIRDLMAENGLSTGMRLEMDRELSYKIGSYFTSTERIKFLLSITKESKESSRDRQQALSRCSSIKDVLVRQQLFINEQLNLLAP